MPRAQKLLHALVMAGVVAGLVLPATAVAAVPSVDEVQQRIRKASAELSAVVEDYNKTNELLARTKADTADVVAKLGGLEGQLDAARRTVSELAAQAYKTGELSAVNAMLDSRGSAASIVERLALLDRLSRTRQQQVDAVNTAAGQVLAEKRRLDGLMAAQLSQQKNLAARKTKIERDLRALYELRRQAYGAAQEAAAAAQRASAPATPGGTGKGAVAVRYAYGALGKPYVWAADGPNGYDCSGLVLAAWRSAGVSLPHNAAMQWGVVTRIGRGSLVPGDLVFYYNLGHVALYIGAGKVIHAPSAGEVVKVASVDMATPYGYGRPRS